MARKNVGLTQAEPANKLGEYHSFVARLEPWGCRGFARGHAQSITKLPSKLGGIDVLVNNAAHQASFKSIDDITDHEWEHTFKVNIHAMFYLTKAAPHMKPGACIVNTASINADTRTGRCWPTRQPKAQSKTSSLAWHSFSPRRASAPMRSPRDRSGRR
jgi:NAD(P)-dependent dehydrogenase (short-subunit alcohol dehydrogenase family)